MKCFFELGNRYAKESNWVDFALTKFCLFAMGILAGVQIKPKYKKEATICAAAVFAATYIPLMAKIFKVMKEMKEETCSVSEEDVLIMTNEG